MEDLATEYLPYITEIGLRLVSAILILIAGWFMGNWAKKRVTSFERVDGTLRDFLGGLVKYTILAVALITVLAQFGVQTASLLAVLGAAGLAIGLALQGTLSNVAAGVMMLFLRPFSVGDYITAGNIAGTVKSLHLFTTELATPDNVFISAPNSEIWNSEIYNYSRNLHRRLDVECGIGYAEDINKAFKIYQNVVDKEERLIRTEEKEPKIMVSSLGDSSVNVTARVWILTSDYWQVKWDLTKAIKEELDKAGINIPFPTRTIEYAGGEPVKVAAKKKS
ncbi:MAG: mechanosensitive ion channel protein MscS [Alphaproteobacteria bacterium]|nr:mechanosensitive ion channel protein MscS [Alphaproteobacteria bacterium]